jgi:hypothetical protein
MGLHQRCKISSIEKQMGIKDVRKVRNQLNGMERELDAKKKNKNKTKPKMNQKKERKPQNSKTYLREVQR